MNAAAALKLALLIFEDREKKQSQRTLLISIAAGCFLILFLLLSSVPIFACLLFAASNRILDAERLPIGVRMFLHYVAIGVVFFAVLGIVGRTVTKSLQVFILLVCITVLYLLFAVFYLLLRRRKKAKQESQNEYKSMF